MHYSKYNKPHDGNVRSQALGYGEQFSSRRFDRADLPDMESSHHRLFRDSSCIPAAKLRVFTTIVSTPLYSTLVSPLKLYTSTLDTHMRGERSQIPVQSHPNLVLDTFENYVAPLEFNDS